MRDLHRRLKWKIKYLNKFQFKILSRQNLNILCLLCWSDKEHQHFVTNFLTTRESSLKKRKKIYKNKNWPFLWLWSCFYSIPAIKHDWKSINNKKTSLFLFFKELFFLFVLFYVKENECDTRLRLELRKQSLTATVLSNPENVKPIMNRHYHYHYHSLLGRWTKIKVLTSPVEEKMKVNWKDENFSMKKKMSVSFRNLILAILFISGQVRIRGDDDPGLVYVPVGPTSDFRMKVPDQPVDANIASSSSTASPFGKNV